MKITKSELKQLIKEALVEELSKKSSKRRVREAAQDTYTVKISGFYSDGKALPRDLYPESETDLSFEEAQELMDDIYNNTDYYFHDCDKCDKIKASKLGSNKFRVDYINDNGDKCYEIYELIHDGFEESCKKKKVREFLETENSDYASISNMLKGTGARVQVGNNCIEVFSYDAPSDWTEEDIDHVFSDIMVDFPWVRFEFDANGKLINVTPVLMFNE